MIASYISKLDVSSAEAREMAMGGLLANVTPFDIHALLGFSAILHGL